jgi:hypothetical protein
MKNESQLDALEQFRKAERTLEGDVFVVHGSLRRLVEPVVAGVDRSELYERAEAVSDLLGAPQPRARATNLNGLRGRASAAVVDLHLVDVDCGNAGEMVSPAARAAIRRTNSTRLDSLSGAPRPVRTLGPGWSSPSQVQAERR